MPALQAHVQRVTVFLLFISKKTVLPTPDVSLSSQEPQNQLDHPPHTP